MYNSTYSLSAIWEHKQNHNALTITRAMCFLLCVWPNNKTCHLLEVFLHEKSLGVIWVTFGIALKEIPCISYGREDDLKETFPQKFELIFHSIQDVIDVISYCSNPVVLQTFKQCLNTLNRQIHLTVYLLIEALQICNGKSNEVSCICGTRCDLS